MPQVHDQIFDILERCFPSRLFQELIGGGGRGGEAVQNTRAWKLLPRKIYWGGWGVEKNTTIFSKVSSKIIVSKYTCLPHCPPRLTSHPEPFTSNPNNQREPGTNTPVRIWTTRVRWWGGWDTGSYRNSDCREDRGHQIREKLHSSPWEAEAPNPQIFNSIHFLPGRRNFVKK